MVILFTLVMGLIVGSFVNVLIHRLPLGQSIVKPGSHCPACKAPIRWWDNIPVVSFLVLRGRCRKCKARISIRYPVIELIVAVLFLATLGRFGFSPLLVVRDWPFVAMLVAITFIDLEHRIIPDTLSLGGLALGLVTAWAVPDLGLISSAMGAAVGFGVFYIFAWLYQRLSGRSGLGGGDIKLLAMLGAFIGPTGVLFTILISSILGSLVGIGWAVAARKKNVMTVAIPYGPFLVIGGLYYYLIGDVWLRSMILI